MLKFLIVGENSINKEEIVDLLLMNKDIFNVAKVFTTNKEEVENSKYKYYLSTEELNICYKNNAILYIKTVLNNSQGITLESFYDNNLIFMNTEDFNNISNKIFLSNNELVVVWLDTKNHDKNFLTNEIYESNYLLEKLENDNIKYLYFLDSSSIEIMDVLIEYMLHEEKRAEILENYQ